MNVIAGTSQAFVAQTKPRCKTTRTMGFTLVELLVVIAIIGILIGMLMPAVQMVREAARRTHCSNNIRQITVGTLHYEGTHRKFPAAYKSGEANRFMLAGVKDQYTGPLVAILPHVEQDNISEYFQGHKEESTPYWAIPEINLNASSNRISMFECPSDDIETQRDRGYMIFCINRTGAWRHFWMNDDPDPASVSWWIDGPRPLTRHHQGTNYLGVAGRFMFEASQIPANPSYTPDNVDRFEGIFGEWNRGVRTNEVRDGLSNTLLFGEVIGLALDLSGRNYMPYTWTANALDTNHNVGRFNGYTFGRFLGLGFASRHSQVDNWSSADGSVHALDRAIDPDVMLALTGRADGEILGEY